MNRVIIRKSCLFYGLLEAYFQCGGGVVIATPAGKQWCITTGRLPPLILDLDIVLQMNNDFGIKIDISFSSPFSTLDDEVVIFTGKM